MTKEGAAKISDFGLAIETEETQKLTQSGMFVGTPHYVSPEHAQGKKIDDACGFHARKRAYSGDDLLEDHAAFDLSCLVVRRVVVVLNVDGGGAIGLEAEVDVEHFEKAAHQQTGAYQQHARQGHL